MQRIRPASLLLLLLVLCLLGFSPPPARAQSDYPGGFTLMPLDPGPVRLLSLIIDVTIRDDGEQAIAEVQAVFRVHNTDKKNKRTLSVAIPGYPAPKPPPQQLSLTIDGKDVPMAPGYTQWWVADIELAANKRQNIVLTYTMPLGATPFVQFRYPLELTAQLWPGTLESARITLSFNEPPNPQSWLRLTPEDYQLTAESITWSYDVEDPKHPIDYILMRPALWEQLRAARQAAVAPDAGADSQIRLGDVYTELAIRASQAQLADFDTRQIFDRYFPLAVAAYSQAQANDPDNPDSYLALARLYRTRADLSQPADPSYISLAVNQLAAALEHGVDDPDIADTVTQDFAELIARARLQGDYDSANTYLKRLTDLATSSHINLENETLAREREQLAVDWISSVLRDEGPAPARDIFKQNFGEAQLYPANGRFARINSLYIQVHTDDGRRTIRITAAPRHAGDPILQDLYEAMLATKAAFVVIEETQPPAIRVDIPFETAEDLLIKEQALALAIPPEPEWSLLSAILRPQVLRIDRMTEGWQTQISYREDINLVSAVTQLSAEAEVLNSAADNENRGDPMAALRADIWRAEAEVWQRLAANNRARFTLIMHPRPGAPVERTWSADPGEQVQMNGRVVQYDIMPMVYMAVLLYLLFVFVTWSLWRYRGRRR